MKVSIIGAGVAGLALANFLRRAGVACVVYEQRSREHVLARQRAGVIDPAAVRIFRARGLEERVVGGTPSVAALQLRIDGENRVLPLDPADHADGRFCPQRVLVKNLMDAYLEDGGDLRFEAAGEDADLVAGCDGARSTTRAAIPGLERFTHDHGFAWLTVLADVAPTSQALMAIHPRGFAGQFARGPSASRFYLQCAADRTWTDDEVWRELDLRFGEPMPRGRIVGTTLVPIRSEVCVPMQHGNAFLLGDAAHLIPPMSAKGMSLALHDADALAHAIVDGTLDRYSETCLQHTWSYQAYATWWTELIHDACGTRGEMRRRLARAELERLFAPGPANSQLSRFLAGNLSP